MGRMGLKGLGGGMMDWGYMFDGSAMGL